MRSYNMTGRLRDTAERSGGARSDAADALLHQSPRRLDGIEVVRVRWQKLQRGATTFDELSCARRAMRRQIVEQHDVAATKSWGQVAPHPLRKGVRGHGLPARGERHPPGAANGANQRQVGPPVHRPWLHVDGPARHPRMRPAHGEVGAGFIEKHEPLRIDSSHPLQERGALRLDLESIDLTRPRPFFLSTYPWRRIARHRLVRVVRCGDGTRRLYSQHNSAQIASGASAITWCRTSKLIGDRHPPPFGVAAVDPLARHRATQRSMVRPATPKSSPISSYVPRPRSYALTARSRRLSSYGFGMRRVKYTLSDNSSANRG
jgi:hypothetical protein